jgi:hypothetical protein
VNTRFNAGHIEQCISPLQKGPARLAEALRNILTEKAQGQGENAKIAPVVRKY